MEKSTWHYFKLGLKVGVVLVAGFIIFLVMPLHERRNKSENIPQPVPKVEEELKPSEPEMSTTESSDCFGVTSTQGIKHFCD